MIYPVRYVGNLPITIRGFALSPKWPRGSSYKIILSHGIARCSASSGQRSYSSRQICIIWDERVGKKKKEKERKRENCNLRGIHLTWHMPSTWSKFNARNTITNPCNSFANRTSLRRNDKFISIISCVNYDVRCANSSSFVLLHIKFYFLFQFKVNLYFVWKYKANRNCGAVQYWKLNGFKKLNFKDVLIVSNASSAWNKIIFLVSPLLTSFMPYPAKSDDFEVFTCSWVRNTGYREDYSGVSRP